MKRVAKWIVERRRHLNAACESWGAAGRRLMMGTFLTVTMLLGGIAWILGGLMGTLAHSAIHLLSPSNYAAIRMIRPQERLGIAAVFTPDDTAETDGVEGDAAEKTGAEGSELQRRTGPFGINLKKWTAWEKYADARELLNQTTVEQLPAGTVMALRLRELPIAFRWCPAGSFEWDSTMCLTHDAAVHLAQDAATTSVGGGRVPVLLSRGFAIMESECFQGMWTAVTGEELHWHPYRGEALPVHCVTQSDAAVFAGRVHSQLRRAKALPEGWIVRLPHEAEWEYAMRAGGQSAFGAGIDSRSLLDHAWIAGNSGQKLQPVASRSPNAWGIHDGLGSVMEWCSDIYSPRFPGGTTPSGNFEDSWKWVYRGGAWGLDSRYSQLSNRYPGSGNVRGPMLGFRLVLVRE